MEGIHYSYKQKPEIYDTFLTDTIGYPGMSGGVFMTSNGELAGVGTYYYGNKAGKAGGAKIKHIIEFVKNSSFALCRDHHDS